MSDSNGTFVFHCVPPGKYMLVERTPDGYVDVTDRNGGDLNAIFVDVSSDIP